MSSIRSALMRPYVRFMIQKKFDKVCDSVEESRAFMKEAEKYAKPSKDTKVEHTEVAGVPADWIETPGVSRERIILYLHGGGCMMCKPANFYDLVSRLSKGVRARALIPDYRLAPEHPFPAAMEDAAAVYESILDQGVSNEAIVMGGDSAGGGLTYQTISTLRDKGVPLPAGAFFMSPQCDFLHYDGESYETRADVDPYMTKEMAIKVSSHYGRGATCDTSLLSLVDADLTGFPPMFIQVGDQELLLSDATRLHDAAKEAGVDVTLEVWDGMWHVFQTFAGMVPESRQALERVIAFSRARLGLEA